MFPKCTKYECTHKFGIEGNFEVFTILCPKKTFDTKQKLFAKKCYHFSPKAVCANSAKENKKVGRILGKAKQSINLFEGEFRS
jgi:hypothetical protein